MTEQAKSAATSVVTFLTHYSFDSEELTFEQLADQWLQAYPIHWVQLAIIEALYQGRYKAISVAQILAFWQRRGQPLHRFDFEFEQLVCNRLPQKLSPRKPKSGVPTATEAGIGTQTEARQTHSNTTTATTRRKTAQNQSPKPGRNNLSSLSLPKISPEITLESLPETAHLRASRGDGQALQVLEKVPLSYLDNELDGALPPSAKPEIDRAELAASGATQPIWSDLATHPIHQFIPNAGVSSFHTKLSAFAQLLS